MTGTSETAGPVVVGIGASAGGLAALQELFADIPHDSGLAFVVVMHLAPEHESHLAELLEPSVSVPVVQVTETTSLEPDRVYVIPPDRNLSAIDTHLQLTPLEEQRSARAPIDHFLRTLSRAHDGHAVGVVLTGTGSDGALGMKEVHAAGGLTIVQDPAEAEYDGMPQAAAATGVVDLFLPLAEIADAILGFASTRPEVPATVDDEAVEEQTARLVDEVLTHVHACVNRDFGRYKKSTVLRRIRRRMQLHQVTRLEDYLGILRAEADETRALADDLLITASSFFRDGEAPAEPTASEPAVTSFLGIRRRLLERYAPRSVLVGPDDRILHLSDEVSRYLLHPPGDMTANALRIVHPRLESELRAGLHRSRTDRVAWRSSPVELDDLGERVVVETIPALGEDEEGFVLVVFTPVGPAPDEVPASDSPAAPESENRQEVEELARLSDDLQNLLAATDIATLFLDRELRILRFTEPLTELFNVRDTDHGRPISDLTHRLGYDELVDDAVAVLRELAPIEREVTDDAGCWYLTRVRAYRSRDDRIDGVVITFVDITARKRTEEQLAASERRFRHVAEAVPSAVFTLDADGRVDYVSRQFETLTGNAESAALGTEMWPSLIHEEDRSTAGAAWSSAYRWANEFEARYRIRSAEGQWRWVLVRALPVQDGQTRTVAWYGSITDVDDLAKAQRALQDVNETLEQRVERRTQQVRELTATLAVAEEETRQRIGQVLHDDLQQHLHSVQMHLAAVRSRLDGHAVGEAAEMLVTQETRLDEVLEITRALTLDLRPPLGEDEGLFGWLSWLASHMYELHGLHVHLSAEPEADVEDHDVRVLVFQVVRELLFNVTKHARTDEASIHLARGKDGVVVRVHDDGVGFDEAEHNRSRRSGFGLFSVHERLRLYGGDVDISSEPGAGTTVTVRAPSIIGGARGPGDEAG